MHISSLLLYILPFLQSIPQVDKPVQQFMQQYHVPGMAVAITYHGKLVYAKGYGYADTTTKETVTTQHLFRIASVSKTITATAIFKLAEEHKLTMDQKVFGATGILGNEYTPANANPNLFKITVKQLLQHTSGGWPNDTRDPMFRYLQLDANTLLKRILQEDTLRYTPGEMYMYSNFGYCILGRVIEKISGVPYEEYVRTHVLQPAGIKDMQTGGNTISQKKNNEVTYYGQNGENPYIHNISRMDSHGGWIANVTDLARLLVVIDGFEDTADILSKPFLTEMTTGSTANAGYASGWAVNMYRNWWHAGSLPGTASEIVRTAKGFNWVILCNTRTDKAFFNDLDGLIWKAVNNKKTVWPTADLFLSL
ncbi:CubicO group peptidase, beta-lactamase class C family [Chitinophaga jiangningensis]|uniref:CubicO group peptidase, beta-lactamase class C family n=1 Tax=Chitinophaga jiangningensis TaxID=1419482 RepID=A0A1M7DKH1_9BACT|nr:serine hydrolase domain-containing protein [Chitinophaga jiangningensis]SHL79965.1 CubicO group peptidase, beta-lactamase class C family [Chitinophaga jiangningensis]